MMKFTMILILCIGFMMIGSDNISAADKGLNMPLENSPSMTLADNNGCNANKVAGSYTRSAFDPTFGKTFVDQLNFGADGTLLWYWTGVLEQQNTLGTASPYIGSWKCLRDGNLLFTVIVGVYLPNGADDIEMVRQYRYTMVYNIDGDTLKRVKRVRKCFLPAEDPTDPNGVPGCGTTYSTSAYDFTRLRPMDSDLDGFPTP